MRIAFGVIIAFVSMSVIVFAGSVAPWFVLGLDAVLEPGRFDATAGFMVYAVLVGILGALFAGWLCATITRSRVAVISLAIICVVLGMTNALAQSRKSTPGPRRPGLTVFQAIDSRKEPGWFTLLMPCAGFAGVLIGGRRVGRVTGSVT